MSCENETAVALRDAGQKVTPQRMLILCTVRHARHHVTAPQTLENVRRSYPYVDASTVYRTLGSAAALGLVTGYFRGVVDEVLMRVVDAFLALPIVIVGMLGLVALGPSTTTVITRPETPRRK